MKFPVGRKIWKLCADRDDDGRPFLWDPYLDVDRKQLAASNGLVMVALDVEIEPEDVSGWVPRKALRWAHRRAMAVPERLAQVACTSTVAVVADVAEFDRPRYGKPFDGSVFGPIFDQERETAPQAVIQPRLAHQLARAVGEWALELRFTKDKIGRPGPTEVRLNGCTDVHAVFMPCRPFPWTTP